MINCIIVDDEPLAREILESFVVKVPFLKLVDSCKNGFEAMKVLQDNEVNLIFLDIQMPDITGIQLYESLPEPPMVIFTTAYSNYAVAGFDMDAVDYLLKPFSFERFLKAVNKAKAFQKNKTPVKNEGIKQREFIFVKDGSKVIKIDFDNVLYLEGMKDYVKIVMKDKYILTLISMQQMAEKLPSHLFVRIHRSYIVAIPKIEKIEKNRVVINDQWLPIGNSFKSGLFEILDKIN